MLYINAIQGFYLKQSNKSFGIHSNSPLLPIYVVYILEFYKEKYVFELF